MSLLNLKQISPLGATVGSVIVNEGTARVWSISSTTGIKIPSGTTAQRPASPPLAILRYNTDTSSYEYWDGSAWGPLGGSPSTLAYTSVTDGTTTHTAAPGQQSITVVGNTGISGVVTAAPSATITIGMNIPGLTITSPFVANVNSFIAYYDGTLNAHRRVSVVDLLSSNPSYNSVTDGTNTHNAASGQQNIVFTGNTGISATVSTTPTAGITIGMNIPGLSVTSPFVANATDFIPYYDGTLNAHRRVSVVDLLSSNPSYNSVTDGTNTHNAVIGQQNIVFTGNTGISATVSTTPTAGVTIGMNVPGLPITSPFVVNNTNFIPYYDGTLNAHRRVSAQDLLESCARTYRTTFVAGDLDTNDNLTVNHNLNLSGFTVGVHVYNQLNRLVIPTYVEFVNANQIIINFTGHGVTGTWRVLVIG